MARDLNLKEFFIFITDSPDIAIVDFHALWCAPCQRFMKVIPRLEEKLSNLGAVIGKVDVDAEPMLKGIYDVTKVPTFLFFHKGVLKHRHEGTVMTIQQVEQTVQLLNTNK